MMSGIFKKKIENIARKRHDTNRKTEFDTLPVFSTTYL